MTASVDVPARHCCAAESVGLLDARTKNLAIVKGYSPTSATTESSWPLVWLSFSPGVLGKEPLEGSAALPALRTITPRWNGAWAKVKQALLLVRAEARKVWLAGNKVHCPCCGRSFRAFIHSKGWSQSLCPNCFSLSRHRSMWLYVATRTDAFTRGDILHFAAEQCLKGRLRARADSLYITADLRNPADVRADITRLPFKPASFDAIICSHILEHVLDDWAAVNEFFRVLKPGGWAMVLVPIDPEMDRTDEDPSVTDPQERENRFGQHDHVRSYGVDFPARLAAGGFAVQALRSTDLVDAPTAAQYDLSGDILFICTKPPASR